MKKPGVSGEERNAGVLDRTNDMKVGLTMLLSVSYPILKDLLSLLDKLSELVDGVVGYAARCIVGSEDVVGRLFVVLLYHGPMPLAFFGELVRRPPVTALVCLVGLLRIDLTVSLCERSRGCGGAWSGGLTWLKHDERLPCSCRAKFRSRSYSCSLSRLWL